MADNHLVDLGSTTAFRSTDNASVWTPHVNVDVVGTAATNLGKAVDAVAGGSDAGVAVLAVRDDALGGITPAAGDYAQLLVDANGALWTSPSGATPAGANLIGDVGIGVRTSGGCTPYKNIDVDESEDQVKGSAGQLYWIHAMNTTAAVIYLKVYNNTAAGTTVGTTIPDLTFPLPTQGDTNGAGFTIPFSTPIAMGTGITIACTGALADNDATAVGANACVVNLGYA